MTQQHGSTGVLDVASDGDAQMGDSDVRYGIGVLAEELGVTTRAIRFYEARGLLSPARIGANRSYSYRDRGRLVLILRAKNLGFSLEDIGEYLALYDADTTQTAQTKLALVKVDAAIANLNRKRADLDQTLRELKDVRAKCIQHLNSDKGRCG